MSFIALYTSQFKAALAAVAGNKEIRFMLHGVCLTADGQLHASDGHQAVIVDKAFIPPEDFTPIIIQPLIPLPAKCDLTVVVDTVKQTLSYGYGDISFKVIDATYPDLRRQLPAGEPIPTEEIGVDVNLLKNAAKVFGCGNKFAGMKLQFYGAGSTIKVTRESDPNITMLVAPCRVK